MAEDLSGNLEVPAPIGYELNAYDGGLDCLGSYWAEFPIPGVHCPKCFSTLDFRYVSQSVRIRGPWDIVDVQGRCIVGERFREFCLTNGFTDVELPCVDSKHRYYELKPTRILEVDTDRSKPILSDFCTVCGNFESYVNGRGLFIVDVEHPLKRGIYRTDLIVGCGIGKHPRIIVAPETAEQMRSWHLNKVEFKPVPYVDPQFERRKADMEAVYKQSRRGGRDQD